MWEQEQLKLESHGLSVGHLNYFKNIVFNDKWSLPVIIFLVIIATMMLMKGTHIVYNKYLEYDNILFCPSDMPIPTALPENSTKKEQDFYNKMKDWIKCPTNGICSAQGAIKCNSGFKLIARDWVKDITYNKNIDDLSDKFYNEYLYHLGDVKWGIISKIELKEFVDDKLKNETELINRLFSDEIRANDNKFSKDIQESVDKRFKINHNEKMTLYCTARKLFQDNLVLI